MKVQRDGRSFTVDVTADGEGLVSHAGSALLAQVADKTGLSTALSTGLAGTRLRAGGHDPGRVIRDLAVMLADGGEALCDLRAVRDQSPLFGEVASDSTAYRAIEVGARQGAKGPVPASPPPATAKRRNPSPKFVAASAR